MWELVTRLLWLPVDIMQRITQRFFGLGRSLYGGLFGPALKPALEPPPSPSPKTRYQSTTTTAKFAAPPSSSSVTTVAAIQADLSVRIDSSPCVIIEMESGETGRLKRSDQSSDVISRLNLSTIETENSSVISETGIFTLNAHCRPDSDLEVVSDTLIQTVDTTSDVDESAHGESNKQVVQAHEHERELSLETTTSVAATDVESPQVTAVVSTSNAQHEEDSRNDDNKCQPDADAAATLAKNKRFREKQKRRQVIKQNESSDKTNVEGEGTLSPQEDIQIQAKKPKLSEDSEPSQASSSVDTIEKEKARKSKKKRSKKNKKVAASEKPGEGEKMGIFSRAPPPNFFIAIQIDNKEIISKVAQFQKSLTEKSLDPPWHDLTNTEIFKDAMVPVTKLHFTMHVMHLEDDDVEKAQRALAECGQEVHKEFTENPMELTIEGIGHFWNKVIFAQLKDAGHISRLTKVSEILRKKFTDLNIPVDPRPFNPHMTIAKISRSNKLYKKKIRSFPPDLWSSMAETNFGIQRVTSLQLLKMAGEDKTTGYYNCFGQYYFEDPLIIPTKPKP